MRHAYLRAAAAIVLLVGASAALIWVWLAVRLTLAGEVERSQIGGDSARYVWMFATYAAGFVFPEISLLFWGALVAVFLAIGLSLRR